MAWFYPGGAAPSAFVQFPLQWVSFTNRTEQGFVGLACVESAKALARQLVFEPQCLKYLAAKGQPYFPANRHDLYLNGLLKFIDTTISVIIQDPGFGEDEIVCRHLAVLYLQANYYGKFVPPASAREVQLRAGKWTEGFYQIVLAQAPCHLLENNALGPWLVGQAQQLGQNCAEFTSPGRFVQAKGFMVTSEGHAMALTLRRKVKGGVARYVLTFYDPSLTTNHMRLVVSSPEGFRRLSLRHLVCKQSYLDYYASGAEYSMVHEVPPVTLNHPHFTQEKMRDAVENEPQCQPRVLASALGVQWQQLTPSWVNQMLALKIGTLPLYRQLFAWVPQLTGDGLWQASRVTGFKNGVQWHFLDEVHLSQWLQLEIADVLNGTKGLGLNSWVDFLNRWLNAMAILPPTLQAHAWLDLGVQLHELCLSTEFTAVSNLVQNFSGGLAFLNGLSAPVGFDPALKALSPVVQLAAGLVIALDRLKNLGLRDDLHKCKELLKQLFVLNPILREALPELYAAVIH